MKRHRNNAPFLEQLKRHVKSLKEMKPDDVHVISVNANFGHYQIVIGPERKDEDRNREIEISGEIHHLFISEESVSAHPTKQQMMKNLKDTVIMRDLTIHIKDPAGDGKHLTPEDESSGLHARECINLAGDEGDQMIFDAEHSPKMSLEAYQIVQEDIIHSFEEKEDG